VPTIGHIAAGLVAGELLARHSPAPRARCLLAGVVLSAVPDLDVIGQWVGVVEDSAWSHRGATHSLVGMVTVGVAFALAAGPSWGRGWYRWAWSVATVLSHGMLDLLTRESTVALFWPFEERRAYLAWRPLPGVDNVGELFSRAGVPVLVTETLVFSPLFLLAWWLSRRGPVGRRV
jgi:inner membrane protein